MIYLILVSYLTIGLFLFFLWFRELYRWNNDINRRIKERKSTLAEMEKMLNQK